VRDISYALNIAPTTTIDVPIPRISDHLELWLILDLSMLVRDAKPNPRGL
jgi:hypothetical protein